jgi:hypothetical protein
MIELNLIKIDHKHMCKYHNEYPLCNAYMLIKFFKKDIGQLEHIYTEGKYINW